MECIIVKQLKIETNILIYTKKQEQKNNHGRHEPTGITRLQVPGVWNEHYEWRMVNHAFSKSMNIMNGAW